MTQRLDNRKLWTLAIFLFGGLGAAVLQTRGALLPSFQQTFSVSESILGLIAPAGTVGFSISVLATGMVAGRIDFKKFLLIGVGFTSVCIFLTSVAPSFFLLLVMLSGRGVASGIFRGLDRTILSHLYPERRGWILNLHSSVWAVGATAGPLLVTLTLWFDGWRLTYFLLGCLFIPVFFLIWKTDFPLSNPKEQPLSLKKLRNILRNPMIIRMAIMLALNGGIEGGFFTWLPYFSNQYFSRKIANLVLTGYLATYVPGRYLYSRLSGKMKYTDLVLINSVVSVLLLFAAFVLTTGFPMLVCILVIGFLVSGIFPLLLSAGIELFPEHSGPINALGMWSGTMGISIFPALMGVIADWYSIQMAMRLLIVLMTGVAILAFVTRKKVRI